MALCPARKTCYNGKKPIGGVFYDDNRKNPGPAPGNDPGEHPSLHYSQRRSAYERIFRAAVSSASMDQRLYWIHGHRSHYQPGCRPLGRRPLYCPAKAQVADAPIEVFLLGALGQPTLEQWLMSKLPQGGRVCESGMMISAAEGMALRRRLALNPTDAHQRH